MINQRLRPGILDDVARTVYLNGQCAALVCAMVERGLGSPVFEVGLARSLDFSGATTHELITAGADHVLLRDNDGLLWDIDGSHNEETYISAHSKTHSLCVLVDYDKVDYIHLVRSGNICDYDMEMQNVDLAATFVAAVMLLGN